MPGWWNGRHKGLKIPRRKACRFESGSGYQISACGGMVDTLVLGTSLRVGVRVPPCAPSVNSRCKI